MAMVQSKVEGGSKMTFMKKIFLAILTSEMKLAGIN